MTIEYFLFSFLVGYLLGDNLTKARESDGWIKFYYHMLNLFCIFSFHYIWWAVVGGIK